MNRKIRVRVIDLSQSKAKTREEAEIELREALDKALGAPKTPGQHQIMSREDEE